MRYNLQLTGRLRAVAVLPRRKKAIVMNKIGKKATGRYPTYRRSMKWVPPPPTASKGLQLT